MSETSLSISDFHHVLVRVEGALQSECAEAKRRQRGRPAGVSLGALLAGSIRQKLFKRGDMGEHVSQVAGERVQASTVSRRLVMVSSEQLEKVSKRLLRPIGERATNPCGYHRNFRMVGIDGTTFFLTNTEANLEKLPKRTARRSLQEEAQEVAFPEVCVSSLVELGPHNPLAVKAGFTGESEMELGCELVKQLTEHDMLLGDRLYGVGWFLHQLMTHSNCGAFLLKVSAAQTSRRIKQLTDGSWLVEVGVRSRRRPADIIATHRCREIAFEMEATNSEGVRQTQQYRLWTNLMEAQLDPAESLVKLYHTRWEHEGYYRELKQDLKRHKHLSAQLPETAYIEILSMVWASSLVARERQRLASITPHGSDTSELEPRQIRFDVVLEHMRVLCALNRQIGTNLSAQQFDAIAQSLSEDAAIYRTPKRRSRTCPRKVRQNQKHWPKLRERTQADPDIQIKVLNES